MPDKFNTTLNLDKLEDSIYDSRNLAIDWKIAIWPTFHVVSKLDVYFFAGKNRRSH